MSSPDVFLRSKVPEEMYDTLQKLAEMRKFDRIKYLKDYSLFPLSDRLLALERKYGNSLNYKDLYGVPHPKTKKKEQKDASFDATMMLTKEQEDTMKNSHRNIERKVKIDINDIQYTEVKRNNQTSHKLKRSAKNNLGYIPSEIKTSRRERVEYPENVEVYLYSCQKLNYFEQQKEEIRKTVANDKANFYTYSPEHLSLAFPLVNENEIAMKEKILNQSKWKTPDGFHNVTKRSKEEYSIHPKKPPQSILDDLKDPFYQQKQRKDDAIKALQRELKTDPNKDQFNLNIKPVYTFSEKDYFNTVFLGGDDVIQEMEEARKAEHEVWRNKLIVDNPHFKVNTRPVRKMQQSDKKKGLLEDPPKKIGIRGPASRLKVMAAKNIVAFPYTSIFMNEKYKDPVDPLGDMKIKDETLMRTKNGFDTNIRNDTLSYSKTSKKLFIKPLQPIEKVGPKWGL